MDEHVDNTGSKQTCYQSLLALVNSYSCDINNMAELSNEVCHVPVNFGTYLLECEYQ